MGLTRSYPVGQARLDLPNYTRSFNSRMSGYLPADIASSCEQLPESFSLPAFFPLQLKIHGKNWLFLFVHSWTFADRPTSNYSLLKGLMRDSSISTTAGTSSTTAINSMLGSSGCFFFYSFQSTQFFIHITQIHIFGKIYRHSRIITSR